MMSQFFSNKILDAILKIVLFSGLLHLSLLVIDFVIHHNTKVFNVFEIVGMTNFFPNLAGAGNNLLLSFLCTIIAIIIAYLITKHPKV